MQLAQPPPRRKPPPKQLPPIRLDHLDQAELRADQPGGPFQRDQRLQQHDDPRRQHDVVAANLLHHLVQRPAQVELVQRLAGVVREEVGHVEAQRRAVQVGRRLAEPQDHRGHVLGVEVAQGDEHFADVFVQPLVDPADHAEIQQPDRAAVHHHQVAGMRIGMVEAVVEDHLQADGRAAPGDLVGVDARRGQPLRSPTA